MASAYSNWIAAAEEQKKELEDKIAKIQHCYIECKSKDDKFAAVAGILGNIGNGSAVTFCKTIEKAEWLEKKLSENGHSGALLLGEVDSAEGTDIIDQRRDNKGKMIITTDRFGKDIPEDQVSTVVINYDVPYDKVYERADCGAYLNRIEQAGICNKGRAITLVRGSKSMTNIENIRDKFRMSLTVLYMEQIVPSSEQAVA